MGLRPGSKNALALFRQGDISLWKAGRLAGIGRREMTQEAESHGLRPAVDDEAIAEELEIEASDRLSDEAMLEFE